MLQITSKHIKFPQNVQKFIKLSNLVPKNIVGLLDMDHWCFPVLRGKTHKKCKNTAKSRKIPQNFRKISNPIRPQNFPPPALVWHGDHAPYAFEGRGYGGTMT